MNAHALSQAKRMARLSGFAYLTYTVLGLYHSFLSGPSVRSFADPDTLTAAAELGYRLDALSEVYLYLFVVVAAVGMYGALRVFSPGLALIGGALRMVEAVLGAGFILLGYAAFLVTKNPSVVEAFTEAQRAGLNHLFAQLHGASLFFILIYMGVGTTIFFFVFFRARLLPRWLAAGGMLTYAVMAVLSTVILLHPPLKQHVMYFFAPGALFEWVVGFWLLIKGIDTRHWEAATGAP